MPELDRTRAENGALGVKVSTERRFYDGSPGRTLVRCPECLREMDPLFPHDKATAGCAELAAETRELRARLAKSSKKETQWGK